MKEHLSTQKSRIESFTRKKVHSIVCTDFEYRRKKMYKIDVIITMSSNSMCSSVFELRGVGESMELATEEILKKYKNR